MGRLLSLVLNILKAFQQRNNFLVACMHKCTAQTEFKLLQLDVFLKPPPMAVVQNSLSFPKWDYGAVPE